MSPFISGLRTFDRLLARLAGAVSAISGFCLVLLVACFGWLVFGRYVLNATPTWVEQVALLLIVVITFFSTASNSREGANLSVDIVPLMLPWRRRRWLLALIDLTLAGFGLLMALKGFDLTLFAWSTKIPMLDLPEGLRTLPLVVCGWLLLLFCGTNAAKRFTEGEPPPRPDTDPPVRGLE
ncbi:MAG TPA: TRAP transporter small permease [Kiloniellaceae bacterium]